MIEAFGKSFEIDIGCVDIAKDIRPSLRRNIASGHHYAFQTVFPGKARNIYNKLTPDHGVIVGKRKAGSVVTERQRHHRLGISAQASGVIEFGLADAPVLAEPAT